MDPLFYEIKKVKKHAAGLENCSNNKDKLTSQTTCIIWYLGKKGIGFLLSG